MSVEVFSNSVVILPSRNGTDYPFRRSVWSEDHSPHSLSRSIAIGLRSSSRHLSERQQRLRERTLHFSDKQHCWFRQRGLWSTSWSSQQGRMHTSYRPQDTLWKSSQSLLWRYLRHHSQFDQVDSHQVTRSRHDYLSRKLCEMKVESGQVVALLIKRCAFLIAAMFGGWLVGGTCLYADSEWAEKRLRTFEKDAEVRVVIGESNIEKHDADEFSLWSSSIRDTSDLSTETTGTSHSTDCENWPIAIGHALAKIPLEIVDPATLNVVRNEEQAGELLIPSTYNMERVHRSLSTEMHLPWCDRYRSLFVVDVSPSAPYVHGTDQESTAESTHSSYSTLIDNQRKRAGKITHALSTLAMASSMTRILLFFSIACARHSNCFWPTLNSLTIDCSPWLNTSLPSLFNCTCSSVSQISASE